ncbi:MAG: polyphosphate kinase 1 [Phycisphaerales bacterium]|nr:polyphosphate kinase 1 [Phycisphaerales bacterium]
MTHSSESTTTKATPLNSDGSPPDPALYVGRDIAWLDFNRRVLAQAQDDRRQLFDRIRFLGICESNLDEFFMKRVALLRRRIELGLEKATHDGFSVKQQLEAARKKVVSIQADQEALWTESIEPLLRREGIRITKIEDLPARLQTKVDAWFQKRVFPLLTPLAVDPGHPFPFISNLSRNFGVMLAEPGESDMRFARVKIPDLIPSWIRVPTNGPVGEIQGETPCRVIRVADLVRRNLDSIFPGLRIVEVLEFRLTRGIGLEDGDDDDVEDIAEWVRASLRHRRFAEAVRLETPPNPPPALVQLLLEELELQPSSHHQRGGPLEWGGVLDLTRFDRPDLSAPRWRPIVPAELADPHEPIFEAIRRGDIFVNHPYDSFRASVERFIRESADDPDVVVIKQCLYRTEPDSPFIRSLLRAADAGKQVTCLVELRARFDEDRNLQLTRTLEKHGIHVAYGVVGLKTHAKCSLVIRREGGGYRAYAHVGTGNYHPSTANLYSDCGILTTRASVTDDLVQFFNYLTGRSLHRDYEQLLVAPVTLQNRLLALIEDEIQSAQQGRPSRIIAKMNQLEDTTIMKALIRASQAGVSIDLIVRGFCCLRAGVPGFTENIRVTSIIGDFLEHGRIYHFARGSSDPMRGDWYIGSADWMDRNLTQRVEVVTPIEDSTARKRLHEIFKVQLEDRHDAWSMQPEGTWTRRHPDTTELDQDGPASLGTFATLRRRAMRAEVDAARQTRARSVVIRETPSPVPIEEVSVLGGVERLVGLAILEAPWRTASEVGRRLGLSPSLLRSTGKRLHANSYLNSVRLGRHLIWIPTPQLAEALGGPMSLLQGGDDPGRVWLVSRLARWLGKHSERVERRGVMPFDVIADSPKYGRVGWAIRLVQRPAGNWLRDLISARLDRVEVVAVDARSATAVSKARTSLDVETRRRVQVQTVASLLKKTDFEDELGH